MLLLTLLTSCAGKQTEHKQTDKKEETPKTLQDHTLDVSGYSRSGDLTEELYEEVVDKIPALKQLEKDIEALKQQTNQVTGKFNQYNSKSNHYYSSADYKASAITDSLLRQKMNALIAGSRKKYSEKNADINAVLKQISDNSVTINDHHTVLKIMLTLPLIEKYQDDYKPGKETFEAFKLQQEKLLEQIDQSIPN